MNEWEWNLLEDKTPLDSLDRDASMCGAGDRVRLRPRRGGDIMDLALAGKTATIEAIEQDYEGRVHVAVVRRRRPRPRPRGCSASPATASSSRPEEVEPLEDGAADANAAHAPRILVAGIGNIFFGDDAFGVEVAQRLAVAALPAGRARSSISAFAASIWPMRCSTATDVAILVDACPRGDAPGHAATSSSRISRDRAPRRRVSRRSNHTVWIRSTCCAWRASWAVGRVAILLVGCEPETLGGEDGAMGLSASVAAAVAEAVPARSTPCWQTLRATAGRAPIGAREP